MTEMKLTISHEGYRNALKYCFRILHLLWVVDRYLSWERKILAALAKNEFIWLSCNL